MIILLPAVARAQLPNQKTIDSLLKLNSTARDDSNEVKLLSAISKNYYPINFKKGIKYGNQALNLAEKIGWKTGIVKALNSLGANYWAKYDFVRAQDYYGQSLKVAREIGDNKYVAINLHDIGICYDMTGNTEKGIEYYKLAIDAGAKTGFKELIMGSYSNIADLYVSAHNYSDALKYYTRSLKISEEINKKVNNAYYYQKLGVVYSALGNHAKALKYGETAIEIFKKIGDSEGLAFCINGLGRLYFENGNYAEAIKQSGLALKVLATISGAPTQRLEADFYLDMGKAYLKLAGTGKPDKRYLQQAAVNFKRSSDIAKAVNFRESADFSLKGLSDAQLALGEFEAALKTYKEYVANKDSITNSEKLKEYTRHELAFEYSRRRDSLNYSEKLQKQELAQVKALSANKLKQRSLYAFVAIVLLLFIASYFFFRSRVQQIRFKSRLAKEKAELELQQMGFESKLNDLTLASLKSQMNPHFIFNCLNSIKFYVEKNDTDAASLYITKFSRLIRSILDSARAEKITLAAEIELVTLYLEMEGMRLKDKLQYKFDIAADIDTEFIEIPPLLIQPYVENAIWHGLMPKETGGTINVNIAAGQQYLTINVADNGIGRDKAAKLKQKNKFGHTSHGSALNNERIALFNAKYKTNTQVNITDLKDTTGHACGTLITIKMLLQ